MIAFNMNTKNPLIKSDMDFFNLSISGSRVLAVVYWAVSNFGKGDNNDIVVLDSSTLAHWNLTFPNKEIGKVSFKNGVKLLISASVISTPITKNVYFVNPNLTGGHHE
uniref:Uncharacterized protein n=1 Tax=Vibrio crassostreae TaxID=246167 RepID=A0A0H3ZUH2_9VIBR|nr:hypothetical protein [Vibrio crassostreae]